MQEKDVHVLLIEDNPGDAKLIELMLQRQDDINFEIEWTTSIDDGYQLSRKKPSLDVILLDLSLPDSSGLASIENLKSKLFKDYPIIVITNLDDEIALSAVARGANDFISKNNLNTAKLVKTIMLSIERQRLVSEIEQARNKFEKLFDGASQGQLMLNHEGVVDKVNEPALHIFQSLRDGVIGKSINDIVTIPNGKSFFEEIVELSVSGKKTDYGIILEKSGKRRTFHVNTSAFLSDEGAVYMLGIEDITQRVSYEAKIREYSNKLKTIYDTPALNIITLDRKYCLKSANIKAHETVQHQFNRRIVAGEVILDLYSEEEREVYKKNCDQAFLGENVSTIIKLSSNEGVQYFEHTFTPVTKDNDEVSEIVVFSRDVTEMRQMENLRREKDVLENLSKKKDEFLANMSHELRTPMNGIIGMLDILSETTTLDDIQQNYLGIIKHSSQQLLAILNQILTLSKLEAGHVKLNLKRVQIKELIKNTVGFYSANAKSKGLEFYFEEAEDLPDIVITDQVRLAQVLNNLLNNALKFTQDGSISLKVKSRKQAGSNYDLSFEIKDSGIGIPEDKIGRIFDKFEQGDNSSSKQYEGTGLGLAITQEIVDLLGGQITCESELDKGSCFTFSIKVHLPEEGAQHNLVSFNEIKNYSFTGCRVLIVEDKFVNYKLLELMLKDKGFEVDHAANGEECLNLFEEDKYDLIFMDIQMPVMDGIECTRKLFENYKNVPHVICVSANVFEENLTEFVETGISEFVPKPVMSDVLFNAILKYV